MLPISQLFLLISFPLFPPSLSTDNVSSIRPLLCNPLPSIGIARFLQDVYKRQLKGNKKYSKELKQQAVLDYLAGCGSQDDICKKYGIRSKGKLQTWIKKYNGHEELKSSGTGGSIVMTKGRKTTFEERVEIVQYCIAHDRNYAQTAEQYQVSYQDVYKRQYYNCAN